MFKSEKEKEILDKISKDAAGLIDLFTEGDIKET